MIRCSFRFRHLTTTFAASAMAAGLFAGACDADPAGKGASDTTDSDPGDTNPMFASLLGDWNGGPKARR